MSWALSNARVSISVLKSIPIAAAVLGKEHAETAGSAGHIEHPLRLYPIPAENRHQVVIQALYNPRPR